MKKTILFIFILSSFFSKAQNWYSGSEGDQGGRIQVYTISSEASLGLASLMSSSVLRVYMDSVLEFRVETLRFMNDARTDSFEINFNKFNNLRIIGSLIDSSGLVLIQSAAKKGTFFDSLDVVHFKQSYDWGNHATEGYLDVATARQSISFTQTGTIDFDLTAVSYQDSSIELIGVETGDVVSIGVPAGAVVADVTYFGWVSATDTVTIRCSRVGGGGAANPASGTFRVSVFRY